MIRKQIQYLVLNIGHELDRSHTFGLAIDGKKGVVRSVKTEHYKGKIFTLFVVLLDGTSLKPHLLQVSCNKSRLIVLQ